MSAIQNVASSRGNAVGLLRDDELDAVSGGVVVSPTTTISIKRLKPATVILLNSNASTGVPVYLPTGYDGTGGQSSQF
jgi:hypothetical protein